MWMVGEERERESVYVDGGCVRECVVDLRWVAAGEQASGHEERRRGAPEEGGK